MSSPAQKNGGKTPHPTGKGLVLAALAVGLTLGLSYLKWGNPVILGSLLVAPTSLSEWLVMPWPVSWGFVCLGCALAAVWATALRAGDKSGFVLRLRVAWTEGWQSRAMLILPSGWLGWQLLASFSTVDRGLSEAVLPQFAACVACFYTGWFGLTGGVLRRVLWVPMLLGFALVLLNGFGQHYGGLEQTREMIRSQPGWEGFPPELLRRIQSDRVFSTLFYANTLAGLVLLVLPPAVVSLWEMASGWPRVLRGVGVGVLGYAGFACLYWSGSKAGWLVASAMVTVLMWELLPRGRVRWGVLGLVVCLALALFALRFGQYFGKGATSAVARLECWQTAFRVSQERPVLGSGPGTFGVMYQRLKKPEAEMSKLVHNDYLEQASDSGWVGFGLFTGFILLAVNWLRVSLKQSIEGFVLWLGVLGWVLHSLVEFGLYIPAIAWSAFVFLGLLAGAKRSR